MENYYKSLDFDQTYSRIILIENLFAMQMDGDYEDFEQELLLWEQNPRASHKYLDELITNILFWFYRCGGENCHMPRGSLNATLIQCAHVKALGSDLGVVPEWYIPNIWDRLQLFRPKVRPEFSPEGKIFGDMEEEGLLFQARELASETTKLKGIYPF